MSIELNLTFGAEYLPGRVGELLRLADLLSESEMSLEAFEAGTARFQDRPQNWHPKLTRGALCV
eukprot:12073838-Alexandrium_andersonii.AAC.1